MPRHPNTICCACEKPIYRRPYQIASGHPVYCSIKCSSGAQTKSKGCPVCGELMSPRQVTCSRACANVRRAGIKYKTGSRRSKVATMKMIKIRLVEERGPLCERCGYDNEFVLQAHHKIPRAKGGSDDLSNLDLLCPNCHATEHYGDSRLAEGVGFEPTQLFRASTVFKTAALPDSANPPH